MSPDASYLLFYISLITYQLDVETKFVKVGGRFAAAPSIVYL